MQQQAPTSWTKPAILKKATTIALFESLFHEVERKPRPRRKKPKVNPLDSEEETESESYSEGGQEGEEWSDAGSERQAVEFDEDGTPRPTPMARASKSSRQLLGSTYGEEQSRRTSEENDEADATGTRPRKGGGLAARGQAFDRRAVRALGAEGSR